MSNTLQPQVSIIMPVFNTGKYLSEAICSVLEQQASLDCAVPDFELVVVDDHSTDPQTLEILQRFSHADPRVTVLKNQRSKGAAGARNTGILHSQGEWIGFLDSDDILTPQSLATRWYHILQKPEIEWIGARFKLLKPKTDASGNPFFDTAQTLFADIPPHAPPAPIKRLHKPVAEFSKSCMVGIMTVLVQRQLVVGKGMFNEKLRRAEDFHLWFQCAFQHDLWILDADIAFYRIHSASLTHGDAPKLLHEDAMIELLLEDPQGMQHKELLLKRFDLVMQDNCYFYRGKRQFGTALRNALQWLKKRPGNPAAWKELLACCLRVA
jgi:glycosyltransferase involved in cell wall biosynthesis